MTDTTTRAGGVRKGRLADTDEGRRLLANPDFRAALDAGRRSGPGPSAEELRRELGITDEDLAAADAELDRLLAESDRPEAPAAPGGPTRRPGGRRPKGDSGNVRVRMPRKLHRELAAQADREGVSLNTLIVTYLAREAGLRSVVAGEVVAGEA